MLVERYQEPLVCYLISRLGNRPHAEEAAQESFFRAFQSLKKLRKPESFYSWLLGIAGRVTQEHFRDLKRSRRDYNEITVSLPEQTDSQIDCHLDEVIALLPETYRQIILMRYYEELSCQEVAQRLEMPLGTVTKTLSRAYALLRQELKTRENI